MYRNMRNVTAQKTHNTKCGKSGFTLVELSVVLALLAILVTMSVSFSVLMNGFASDNKAEYDYLEDHAALKEALCTWVAENDVSGSVFSIGTDGTLIVTKNGSEKSACFFDGTLLLGEQEKTGLNELDGVIFTSNGKLLKCTTYRIGDNGQKAESSFVFSPRCGVIEEAAENG